MTQPGDHESGRRQAAAQIRRDARGTHRAQSGDPAGRTVSAPRLATDYLLPELIQLTGGMADTPESAAARLESAAPVPVLPSTTSRYLPGIPAERGPDRDVDLAHDQGYRHR
jgi:hypothetical protein